MLLPDGARVRGSAALRVYSPGRRIYAYLRWSEGGKTKERYVGEVDAITRGENLAAAWQRIHASGLLDQTLDVGQGQPLERRGA